MDQVAEKKLGREGNWRFMLRALRSRNYRLFFLGQGTSLVGTWMQQVAMSWLTYRLVGSELWLGVVAFAGRAPIFFLTPFMGVLADRWDRRRILLVTQVLSMVQAGVLAWLVLTNQAQVWHLVGLSLLLGAINALDIPARQSFIVEMIESRKDLGNAIALNSSMVNMARLIGPSAAGLIIAFAGEGICFLLNAISYVAVLVALLFMKLKPFAAESIKVPMLTDLMEGARYVFGSPTLRSVLLLISLVSLMGMPYTVLMPVFAKDVFHAGPHGLGFLMAAAGGGALIGAMYLAWQSDPRRLPRLIIMACLLFGTSLVAFALSPSFWLSLLVLVLTGVGMMIQLASSNTAMQLIVDDDKRGRLMSFYTIAFMGTAPFGALLGGALADKIGAPYTVMVGGISCILGAGWFLAKAPKLKKELAEKQESSPKTT